MKKILSFITILAICLAFSACEKASSDVVSGSVYTPTSGSGGSTGGPSSGGATGGGTTSGSGFSAVFSIDVNDIHNVYENNIVKFTSKGTGIVSYVWRLGDGRKSGDANPTITYPYHGNYTISLTVIAADGKTETFTKELSVLCNFFGGAGSH